MEGEQLAGQRKDGLAFVLSSWSRELGHDLDQGAREEEDLGENQGLQKVDGNLEENEREMKQQVQTP